MRVFYFFVSQLALLAHPSSSRNITPVSCLIPTVSVQVTLPQLAGETWVGGVTQMIMKYDTEKFVSGQVGILFSGSVTGFVRKLEVNGRIDYKKMYEFLTKSKPR